MECVNCHKDMGYREKKYAVGANKKEEQRVHYYCSPCYKQGKESFKKRFNFNMHGYLNN